MQSEIQQERMYIIYGASQSAGGPGLVYLWSYSLFKDVI